MGTRVITLLLFAVLLVTVPAQAEFWAISNYDLVVDKKTDVSPPQYWLKGFTFPQYEIPGGQLVVGQSTGAVNVDDEAGRRDITLADNFELNDFAPRNGVVPPEITTVNFGGSPTWQDTNGDKFDFFVFEAGGNDEFAVQAILPGGVLGQKVIVPSAKWMATGGEPLPDLKRTPGPNNNQQIAGIAFKVTDLLDESGKALTNESVIEGLVITSPGLDPSCICAVTGTPFASGPSPADGAVIDSATTLLQWSPGLAAVSEEVYFSMTKADVENLETATKLATVTQPVASPTAPGSPYAGGLVPGVYYWRVVTVDATQGRKAGPIWSFTVLSGTAFDPAPADGALYVPVDADLNWSPGADAVIHYVYIGTDADEIANATQDQATPTTDSTFDPGALQKDKTYYWRVDEFTGSKTTRGEVWSFSTLPAGAGGLKAEYFAGQEQFVGDPITRIDPQIDFDWNQTSPDPAIDRLNFSVRWKGEILIPAAGTYTFITRSNDGARIYINDQLVVADWSTHTVRDAFGNITLEAGSYPIAVEYFQQGGSAEMHILWRSDLIPQQIVPSLVLVPAVRARWVYPADGAANVSQSPRLRWEGSTPEAQHDVYLGEDAAAVEQADTTSGVYLGRQDEASYVADLEPGKTYCWRVDEVVAGDPQSPIKGRVWTFTTAEFIVVDDFEGYTNDSPNRVFQTWIDGWGFSADEFFPQGNPGNGTGSAAGYDPALGNIMELVVIHGGQQSMPFTYDNSSTTPTSEAERSFTPTQNWTGDLKALALWFRGVAPVGSFSYDAAKSQYTVGGSGTGIADNADGFRFVYKKLTGNGSITARIESIGHTNDWAMAGVMFRETLEPGSPMAISSVRATGQAILRWRDFANATVGTVEVPEFPATIVIPHYVRLSRTGSSFTAEHSSDGTTWEPIGDSVTVSMGQPVYVGLAVSANVPDAQGVASTSVLSNVGTTGTVDAAGTFQNVKDIGMGGNSPQPFYVVVQDKAGKTAVVSHPAGPDAIVTNTWTEWLVSLDDIAGQGVNLGAVSVLTIGVGNRTGAAMTGSGTLYVDDIRLYDSRFVPGAITVGPIEAVEVTGDNGTVLSINGIDVSNLILGTSTFAGAPKYADQPPEKADDFDAGGSASSDDQAYMQTVFAQPVSRIFLLEKGANDSGYIQPLNIDGVPTGGRVSFTASTFYKSGNKFGGQTGGGIVIAVETPIYGIRILPPDSGVLGIDPVTICAVAAP